MRENAEPLDVQPTYYDDGNSFKVAGHYILCQLCGRVPKELWSSRTLLNEHYCERCLLSKRGEGLAGDFELDKATSSVFEQCS